MSTNGLEIFDKTVQTTNAWLDDIMDDLGPDRQMAWKVLSSVLHKLRDRLPANLAAHLAAQLPLLVRGAYYDQYQPGRQPRDWNSADSFIQEVRQSLADSRPVNAKDAVVSVFRLLSRRISTGEIAKVRAALPRDMRRLWSESLLEPAELES